MKRFSQAVLAMAVTGVALMASGSTLAAPGGEPSGIVRSGPLNHPIPATWAGTSLNIVSATFDDTGPMSGDWDFRFFSSSNRLTLWKINSPNGGQYAVDGDNMARLFQAGDTIGPHTTFSSGVNASVLMSDAWRAGTNGYLGVKFQCNGRLPQPVAPPGVCYGFVHLETSVPDGIPATILDTAFDGDGNPITVDPSEGDLPPQGMVTPAALTFAVEAGASDTRPLTIANIGGNYLLYVIHVGVGSCGNPGEAPWLDVTPASGTVQGGARADVVVTADAAGLAEGHYSASLCVVTNKPHGQLITVPVSLTVMPAAPSEPVFCSGFEPDEDGDCGAVPAAAEMDAALP